MLIFYITVISTILEKEPLINNQIATKLTRFAG